MSTQTEPFVIAANRFSKKKLFLSALVVAAAAATTEFCANDQTMNIVPRQSERRTFDYERALQYQHCPQNFTLCGEMYR